MKDLLVKSAQLPGIRHCWQWMMSQRATIFMLHRFAVPELGVHGMNAEALRSDLAYLRANGYHFLELDELFDLLENDAELPKRAISFTIDDGYTDQLDIAIPAFLDYDCPVTTFVCTGFLDGELWMWWDKIEYIADNTKLKAVDVHIATLDLCVSFTETGNGMSPLALTEHCKTLPNRQKLELVAELAKAAEVDLPVNPPEKYRPMSWDGLRAAERKGAKFGPHTLTHPVLSRVETEAECRREIEGSVVRLAEEAESPSKVFCYPSGQRPDFGDRECHVVADLKLAGGVAGYPGYASRADFTTGGLDKYRVKRFSFPEDRIDLIQYASGFEHLKSLVRGE